MRFILYVSFAQVAVFLSSLEHPFNEWTDEHVAQGFSWRKGSVSFRTLEEAGDYAITVNILEELPEVSLGANRVIEVPFEVPEGASVEIASISDSNIVDVPGARYILRYEAFPAEGDTDPSISLIFAKSDSPRFRVCVAD
ncbi:MAG: hypothetical protein QOJ65_2500, partial [Fimbriimonadaceae bacterium]|nr:hypothetical protein [Fimbriimonadaceae bacterium]